MALKKALPPKSTRPHMPGYGVPKSNKGLLPWTWAEKRLNSSHNYWITTVRADARPHTMIVWGVWIDNAFYFSTGSQSRKARNLAKNPRCIVCTERADEAVIVEGKATLTKNSPGINFFTRYEKKYKWDMSSMQSEPIYRVTPRIAFGLYEKKFANSATRWKFS